MLSAKAKNNEWKSRWCVLQGVTFGTFASRSDKEPHKVVNLYGAKIEVFRDGNTRQFGILMTTKGGIVYQLAADSETDQQDWAMRLADVAKYGTKSQYFSGSKRGARGTVSKATSPAATTLASRKVDECVVTALRKEVPAAAAAAATTRSQGASNRKKMFSSEEAESAFESHSTKRQSNSEDAREKDHHHLHPQRHHQHSKSEGKEPKSDEMERKSADSKLGESLSAVPHKIMELYEKNKHRLLLGGIGKEEFSRNSEVILQVLSAEESMDASSKRYNKLKVSTDMTASSEDLSDDSEQERSSQREVKRSPAEGCFFLCVMFLFVGFKERNFSERKQPQIESC